MICADLHCHSNCSDGSLTPRQVVERAARQGVAVLALTDHDTTAGLHRAHLAARRANMELVDGVELSCKMDSCMVHLLGLYVDPKNHELHSFLKRMRDDRAQRNRRMLQKLCALGLLSGRQDLTNRPFSRISRVHFALALVEKGHCRTTVEAFETYLSRGKPGYVPRPKPLHPFEAIEKVHQAGGVAVLAHLYQISSDRQKVHSICGVLKEKGLDAIETRYSCYDEEYSAFCDELCREFGFLPSGGSDFHGIAKPDIEIGTGRGDLFVPAEFAAALRKKAEQYAAGGPNYDGKLKEKRNGNL